MTLMSFLPELKNFLRGSGCIYTVRKYKMIEKDVEVDGIGTCHRTPLGGVSSLEDLEDYYQMSGFATAKDWWEKIRYFIPPGSPMYLYRVEKNED